MKKILFVAALALVSGLSSCQKNENGGVANEDSLMAILEEASKPLVAAETWSFTCTQQGEMASKTPLTGEIFFGPNNSLMVKRADFEASYSWAEDKLVKTMVLSNLAVKEDVMNFTVTENTGTQQTWTRQENDLMETWVLVKK